VLETFTLATFQPLVGERFEIDADHAAIEAVLAEASAPAASGAPDATHGGARSPFSIVFHGPLEPILPQRIYPLRHHTLGSFELFIVPIGPDGDAMQYQAVFT
jgi:Domain of unknown function (DUF6916)